jgi:Holliday junction resolvase RusA-like endonuclease
MVVIKTKPLSVNACWRGRRFKTPLYKNYEWEVYAKLPPLTIPKGELQVSLIFYLSNKLNDIDNSIKPFLDILQKKYNFNDRDIYELKVVKKIVGKGKEGICFNIEPYTQ